jgi:4-amino-4-deoxy-L-arabinose transferase-like glycosyltransferase
MNFAKMKRIHVLFLVCILCIGFLLRYHNYTQWPREGATFDEFAWTFLGLSLWQTGTPTSWSPHAAYKKRVEYFNPKGAHFTLVTPYLEHPPLFGLVAGGFARLNGVTSFDEVRIARIRPLALALGVFSVFAVFILATEIYGVVIGLIASGIYAITPTVAIGSRLVQNENFFIPLFLLSLFFAYRYIKYSSSKDLWATTVICALLPLAKVPWIASPIAVVGVFIFSRKWKAAWLVGVTTLIFFSGFVVYGLSLDSQVFLSLWKLQLARYDMAFDSLFIIFREPLVVDRLLVDGWIYFGWGAMMTLLLKDIKKNLPVVLGFLAYGAIFVFAIPSEPLHGWYRYPFYPFLAIALAVFLHEYFNKKYFVTALFFVVTGLSMFAGSWGKTLGFSFPVFRIYLGVVAVGALPGLFPKLESKKLFPWINIVTLIFIIVLTVCTILVYNEQ